MAFSMVSLGSPGLGGESLRGGRRRRVSQLGLRTILSLFSVTPSVSILSGSSQLTDWTKKQHLRVAAVECSFLPVQMYVEYTVKKCIINTM